MKFLNLKAGSNVTHYSVNVRLIIVISALFILSACHTLPFQKNKTDFSHYYLWIKSLNDEEVIQEIKQQKQNKLSGYANADLQLTMLYSLPNSPIHNPYTAKSQLNAYQLEPYNSAIFNATDLAFVVMLKDQLNQQLLLLKELNNYKDAYQQSKVLIASQVQQIETNQQTIALLNKQIVQLQKIEKAISERGQ